MNEFIELTQEEQKVLINLNHIIMIMINDGKETYLRLTHGYTIVVSETIDEIKKNIELCKK